jgi:hypothetical protein
VPSALRSERPSDLEISPTPTRPAAASRSSCATARSAHPGADAAEVDAGEHAHTVAHRPATPARRPPSARARRREVVGDHHDAKVERVHGGAELREPVGRLDQPDGCPWKSMAGYSRAARGAPRHQRGARRSRDARAELGAWQRCAPSVVPGGTARRARRSPPGARRRALGAERVGARHAGGEEREGEERKAAVHESGARGWSGPICHQAVRRASGRARKSHLRPCSVPPGRAPDLPLPHAIAPSRDLPPSEWAVDRPERTSEPARRPVRADPPMADASGLRRARWWKRWRPECIRRPERDGERPDDCPTRGSPAAAAPQTGPDLGALVARCPDRRRLAADAPRFTMVTANEAFVAASGARATPSSAARSRTRFPMPTVRPRRRDGGGPVATGGRPLEFDGSGGRAGQPARVARGGLPTGRRSADAAALRPAAARRRGGAAILGRPVLAGRCASRRRRGTTCCTRPLRPAAGASRIWTSRAPSCARTCGTASSACPDAHVALTAISASTYLNAAAERALGTNSRRDALPRNWELFPGVGRHHAPPRPSPTTFLLRRL